MTSRRPGPAAAVAAIAAVVALGALVLAPAVSAASPQWNIDRIGGPASAPGVVIAVVDTGVDATHPVFTGRVQPAIDLVGGNGGDPNGHGTHVAGVAAGADNGCGSIGVAPDATILPVRVLDENGAGTIDAVAEGIRRATDRGATVINLSLGTDVVLRNLSGSGLQDAIRYAWGKGSIPVLAAGNDGVLGGLFGSGYGDLPAVVVTATDHENKHAPGATSIGSARWGVAAPGGNTSGKDGQDILSAFPGDLCALQAGTSMAAPHVSGALAALRAKGLNPQQAVDRLLSSARDLGSATTFGHGLIDLRAALGTPPTTVATVAATPPKPATTTQAPARAAPTTTTVAPAGTAPPAPGTSTAPPAPDDAQVTDEIDSSAGEPGTSRPSTTDTADSPQESAAPVVVRDIDEDDDGVPGALVAAAVAVLAVTGVAAGAVARTTGRRPGPS
jgi:subtilisin family serine protease